MYVTKNKHHLVAVAVYVDDLIIVAKEMRKIKEILSVCFKMTYLKLTCEIWDDRRKDSFNNY